MLVSQDCVEGGGQGGLIPPPPLDFWKMIYSLTLYTIAPPLPPLNFEIFHFAYFAVFLSVRFFFGKSKVMQLALGRTDSDEFMDGLHLISKVGVTSLGLISNVGMLIPIFVV